MLVSSKHLCLASSYFRQMLKGNWQEGATLSSHGYAKISLNECDPGATLILLNIIHGHTRSVPRHVDLKMLTKLAVLVDFYDCHETVEVFSDLWVDSLKGDIPTKLSKDLIRWLCISWVFQKAILFRDLTRIALRQSKGPIKTLGLPIPSSIVS